MNVLIACEEVKHLVLNFVSSVTMRFRVIFKIVLVCFLSGILKVIVYL